MMSYSDTIEFLELPSEIQSEILGHLPARDLGRSCAVSHLFNELCSADDVWTQQLNREFPLRPSSKAGPEELSAKECFRKLSCERFYEYGLWRFVFRSHSVVVFNTNEPQYGGVTLFYGYERPETVDVLAYNGCFRINWRSGDIEDLGKEFYPASTVTHNTPLTYKSHTFTKLGGERFVYQSCGFDFVFENLGEELCHMSPIGLTPKHAVQSIFTTGGSVGWVTMIRAVKGNVTVFPRVDIKPHVDAL